MLDDLASHAGVALRNLRLTGQLQQKLVRGSGLQNMVDRIEALGGSLEFRSTPGHGTTVEGVVPIETEHSLPVGGAGPTMPR